MPALATGCTAVIRPVMETPPTALRLAELVLEAGIPAGVFNVVTGGGASVDDVACMENITRFSLELGGKNPIIVLADADIDHTMAVAREEVFGPALEVMPFSGVKQSGMVREFGRAVIEAYTELKSVCITH